ncbi:nucleolar protein 58-like [Abrus precatorius]|uniref:Nucleolar protein 58-like n=1 Tax=Abrus precatorius TaxID=3816 RepID=A0A8B8LB71_ABRPR|nr:nucleolar protein 58-like [Abrus precatorius]
MSGLSDEEISNADRHGSHGGGSDGDDDNDDDSEIGKTERRRTGSGFGKEIEKAKKAVQHQFSKAKKKLRRIRGKKPLLPSQSSNARTKGSGWKSFSFDCVAVLTICMLT